jgi:hypothetical protein
VPELPEELDDPYFGLEVGQMLSDTVPLTGRKWDEGVIRRIEVDPSVRVELFRVREVPYSY